MKYPAKGITTNSIKKTQTNHDRILDVLNEYRELSYRNWKGGEHSYRDLTSKIVRDLGDGLHLVRKSIEQMKEMEQLIDRKKAKR